MTIKFNDKRSAYLEERELERRIKFLENLMYERAFNRNGSKSRAYIIWELLRDQGPMTRPQVRAILKHTQPILDLEAEGAVTKNGNLYTANLDYDWEDAPAKLTDSSDDVRDTYQNLISQTKSGNVISGKEPLSVASPAVGRARGRAAAASLFSSKLSGVQSAINAGEDVNTKNENGVTPLAQACSNNTADSARIVKLLLENGADPNEQYDRRPLIYTAVDNGNADVVKNLVDYGANVNVKTADETPFEAAINSVINGEADTNLLIYVLPDFRLLNSRDTELVYDAVTQNKMPVATGKEIISAMLSKCPKGNVDSMSSLVYSDLIAQDLGSNDSFLFDALVENGVFPCCSRVTSLPAGAKTKALNKLYSALKLIKSGKIKYILNPDDYPDLITYICTQLDKPLDAQFLKCANTDMVNNLMARSPLDAARLIRSLADKNLYKQIENIARGNLPKDTTFGNSLIQLILSDISDEKCTEAVTHVISKVMPSNFAADMGNFSNFYASENIVAVDYILDNGGEERVINDLASHMRTESGMSDVVREIINERGLVEASKQEEIHLQAQMLVNAINSNKWHDGLSKFVRDFPETMFVRDVQKLIKDPDNATNNAVISIKAAINSLPRSEMITYMARQRRR